jgi:hypothetical protein
VPFRDQANSKVAALISTPARRDNRRSHRMPAAPGLDGAAKGADLAAARDVRR